MKKRKEKGEGDTYLHKRRMEDEGAQGRKSCHGREGCCQRRGVIAMGVPLRKVCRLRGVSSREMLLRVERREKEAVRVGRWEVEILLRILLYFQ